MYRDTYDFLEKMENTKIANLRLLTRAPGQGVSQKFWANNIQI